MAIFLFIILLGGIHNSVATAPVYEYKPTIIEESKLLALQISKLKQSHSLEYKSIDDLNETTLLICKMQTPVFDKYDIAAIVMKESRFNHLALNKKDGSKGLMQVLKQWTKSIPWYKNPYDKHQSIKAGVYVLEQMHAEYKTKNKAIIHYNGSCDAAVAYQKHIAQLKREIKSVKI